MHRFHTLSLASVALVPVLTGCTELSGSSVSDRALARASAASSDEQRQYGTPVAVGDGRARAYVVLDRPDGTPVEIGIALDERALENLPTEGSGHHDGHMITHEFIVQLPARHGTQFQFVEMNWNPMGHEPPGVYDVPHFDFHFYTISKAERDTIVPSNPEYVAKANALPASEYVPEFALPLGPPGASPAEIAVPKMGVHWIDVRSPELQGLLGNPDGYAPFTSTFIIGSWAGKFHFWEPMITRAHILETKRTSDPAVRDQILPISTAARYQVPGYYPTAYRITWDARAKEYRIALTGLVERE